MDDSLSMRASGTRTVPMRSSPPKPTGTSRPVMVLKTVVLPEPGKPTSPIFIRPRFGSADFAPGEYRRESDRVEGAREAKYGSAAANPSLGGPRSAVLRRARHSGGVM